MICEQYEDDFECYAIGALEPHEQAEIAQHLGTGCPHCRSRLRNALILNTLICSISEELSPRPTLRKRVLRTLVGEPRARRWLLAWAAVAACLLITLGWINRERLRNEWELAESRQLIREQVEQGDYLRVALSVLSDQATKLVTTSQTGSEPRASYYLNPTRGVVLIGSHLNGLASGRIYQMWIISNGQAPRPAGLFRPDSHGNAVHLFESAHIANAAALAVTVEPETGSPAPTTTPILVASTARQ